jgi:hypothetical protein
MMLNLVQDARFIEGFLNQKSYKIDWYSTLAKPLPISIN